jgi:hypothetical protein
LIKPEIKDEPLPPLGSPPATVRRYKSSALISAPTSAAKKRGATVTRRVLAASDTDARESRKNPPCPYYKSAITAPSDNPTSDSLAYQFAFLPSIKILLVGVIVPIVLNIWLIIRGCQGAC